ncbi:DNA ligase OB-like domain-containing protein [Jimgerdemannia flammicorona]|uniref:DNA ligase OB-like domain-containing protein n=1 Tax=Jimgerdemannia flammicorona TaxID=994334 RepID=A0A433QAC4_9FUNG|nr:DNA ligase OB-like domain-containing protein [Jimgerdemannia flammicorona]
MCMLFRFMGQVQMASGKLFKVASGMSDKERKHPPKLGAIVVYKCQELSKDGVPRFPIYLGVAADKTKPTDPDMTSKGGNQAGKPATGHNDD